MPLNYEIRDIFDRDEINNLAEVIQETTRIIAQVDQIIHLFFTLSVFNFSVLRDFAKRKNICLSKISNIIFFKFKTSIH